MTRYGEMSVMIIPIVYTGGEYAAAKTKEIADISKISVTPLVRALGNAGLVRASSHKCSKPQNYYI